MSLFQRHRPRLERAVQACHSRTYWSPFQESAGRKHHPEGARAQGQQAFEQHLGKRFDLGQPHDRGWLGHERSPYTGQALGIQYAGIGLDTALAQLGRAAPALAATPPEDRVGMCMEMLDRLSQQCFENAFATMHTAGQGFSMAFAGSGANSLDRGLEAIAHAWEAMSRIPQRAVFSRSFGPGAPVVMDKRYHLVPRGPAVVVSCGSYPAWNAYPAIFANLATGNPVLLKPHPDCVLPMAIAARTCRRVLREAGLDPALLGLVVDSETEPITMDLLQRPEVAIIDFTGSQRFGRWIEENCRHARVYTETAGCNAVVMDGARDLDAVVDALAFGLCIFSSQMCTAAQNIWVPAEGIQTPQGLVSGAEFTRRLCTAIDTLTHDPATAAAICGALQTPRIARAMDCLAAAAGPRVARAHRPYPHPHFPRARTATPLVVSATPADGALYQQEHFGPMAFVITGGTRRQTLAAAAQDARQYGSIAAYAYTIDPVFQAEIEGAFLAAGASLGINLLRQRPINYTAAFSDFHVTGLNPAGTASLTEIGFVADRFRVVQSKVERPLQ